MLKQTTFTVTSDSAALVKNDYIVCRDSCVIYRCVTFGCLFVCEWSVGWCALPTALLQCILHIWWVHSTMLRSVSNSISSYSVACYSVSVTVVTIKCTLF